ncbi:hypothetical protein GCM10009612_53730 [Streptomyces beijiangensis]
MTAACLAVLAATPASGHATESKTTSAPRVTMRQEKNYQVEVDNFSNQAFDEVALAFTRNSIPVTQILHQFNVPASSVIIFDLGPCSDIKQYAVSGLVSGERQFTTGDVDADPVGCDDIITIRNTAAPEMQRKAR